MLLELDLRGGRYLERVRKIAFALPEVVETESFGHPWFRAGGKMFTVFGDEGGGWSLCFKCGKQDMGIFLEDPRFVKTPYVGQHGWVTLRLDPVKPNWDEVADLMKMSYRNNAPAKLRNKV